MMNVEMMAVKDIKPFERNAKKHDETQIKNVMESIKQFGFAQPLVVDKDNVLIIGHCRLIASKRLKLDSVPVVKMDELTQEQVDERTLQGLVNKTETKTSKSYAKILLSNIFTFFNIICLACAIALWCVGSWSDTIFMLIVVANTLISIIQEIKAKKTIEKISLVSSPNAIVVRDKEERKIPVDELVLDDIIFLQTGKQICADSIVIDGSVEVNECLLTG